ncbi:Sec39-domain-containing protein [Fomitopsis serialis]|uniref:Sec39-domain-containing protein n=1 Tax=Fomitopsis serialis TaxID=139415 RepID=UPI00200819A6|nr:Sec39-domain-containing protein [Neoantrodia serialis]KAH9937160.1 Sec39-domain-containing protein [Neoantrodia serialis]
MASTSTSTSPHDLCTQWTALADEDLTARKVDELLRPVSDDLWVAAACADRILEDAIVQRSVLDLGIERTASAIKRVGVAYSRPSQLHEEEDPSEDGPEKDRVTEGEPQEDLTRHTSLVSHFRGEPADVQLCRIRAVLLDRLDRLSTFVEVCKEAPPKETEETVDEEWEDPWADEANDTAAESSPSATEPPLPLSTFLTADLLQLACMLASSEHASALRVLMNRLGHHIWPYRFSVIDCIPEYALATQFLDSLPIYDPSGDKEQIPKFSPWRSEPDFSEHSVLPAALGDAEVPLDFSLQAPVTTDLSSRPDPLSAQGLATWYRDHIDLIISSTGMIDAALLLIQHAASQGLPGLDEVGEELSLLSRLVYDAPAVPTDTDEDWTLARWRSMEPSAVVRAYLTHSTPVTVAKDISRLVMPYLFVLESRAERAGTPDPSLPTRLLYEYVLNAPLEIVAAVFEASKPTLSPAQRLIRNDEDMARLALACLYGSDSLDEWSTMSRIFECLPAWETANDEDEADEADTTIASLGAFVAPSTTRQRATPADLMLFFQPLPPSALSRALDVLDVHLESGEILARWEVPAPLRWFLQSNGSIAEQRSWANRMARRAGGTDKLETQEDWEWLLEDMLKLSESGDSGAWSTFCLLSQDDIARIYFSGLLSTGKFDIAKHLLRSSSISMSLEPSVIEDICLTCSQEFYDNASSGNYHFSDMKLAYDCLDIPAPSERVIREREFIEATTRLCSFNLMSRPGIPITPLEIRLTKDRLSLVSRVLSSNSDAYKHTQVILDLVYKLGFRGDVVAEVKTLAMLVETAVQAEDFPRAFETSQSMIDTVLSLRSTVPSGLQDSNVEEASEVCWVACYQLGRHPEFEDVPKKLTLVGRALELCPSDRMADVLAVWHRLEDEDLQQRRERLDARRKGGRTVHARKRAPTAHDPVASLAARLQHLRMPDFQMPHSPLTGAEDAAALAGKAFNRVAANFPFSVGNRGRTLTGENGSGWGSREGSRAPEDGADVSVQASRVLQAGIGWLLGGDDDN